MFSRRLTFRAESGQSQGNAMSGPHEAAAPVLPGLKGWQGGSWERAQGPQTSDRRGTVGQLPSGPSSHRGRKRLSLAFPPTDKDGMAITQKSQEQTGHGRGPIGGLCSRGHHTADSEGSTRCLWSNPRGLRNRPALGSRHRDGHFHSLPAPPPPHSILPVSSTV